MLKHKYQLVIQFKNSAIDASLAKALFRFEEELEKDESHFVVNGNDIGKGAMNIFLDTNDPELVYQQISPLIPRLCEYAVAYRDFDEEDYHILFPPGTSDFEIS